MSRHSNHELDLFAVKQSATLIHELPRTTQRLFTTNQHVLTSAEELASSEVFGSDAADLVWSASEFSALANSPRELEWRVTELGNFADILLALDFLKSQLDCLGRLISIARSETKPDGRFSQSEQVVIFNVLVELLQIVSRNIQELEGLLKIATSLLRRGVESILSVVIVIFNDRNIAEPLLDINDFERPQLPHWSPLETRPQIQTNAPAVA